MLLLLIIALVIAFSGIGWSQRGSYATNPSLFGGIGLGGVLLICLIAWLLFGGGLGRF